MHVKITQAGQPCRKCGMPVIRRSHATPPKPTKTYYFEWWFVCPKCKALYMVEDAKRFFHQQAPAAPALFGETEVAKPEDEQAGSPEDERPPWE